MNAHTVVYIWPLYYLGLQTFDILHLYPKIGSHTLWAVYAFGVAQKQAVFHTFAKHFGNGGNIVTKFVEYSVEVIAVFGVF